MKSSIQVLKTFGYLIIGLVFISCSLSIFNNDIYQDGAWANAQWLGQDVVSLFLAVPFLWIAQYFALSQIFFLLISILLTCLWLSDIFHHLIDPDYLSSTPDGEAPLIIYSLDLAIVIPLMLTSIYGLWKGWQLDLKTTGIMLIKASTLGFALMAMSLSMMINKLSLDIELIILWCIIGLIGALLSILYFRNVQIQKKA